VPPREWRLRVRDILQAVERIEAFTRGLTFEAFAADERTIAAVSYELLVIGEAARRVTQATRDLAPDVPWQDMADMRNVVAHEYFGVDITIVWQTATQDVAKLGAPLRTLLGH
jgi:uncharacterized protein with HEPN domain